MALIGHSLVADELYGGVAAAGMHRQALHAWQLRFIHPMTRARMQFQTELPKDFADALKQWRLSYTAA
jgi:23S rRNA pseudouridine1911/1915/1917 synthase